jgi:hypothetical protein
MDGGEDGGEDGEDEDGGEARPIKRARSGAAAAGGGGGAAPVPVTPQSRRVMFSMAMWLARRQRETTRTHLASAGLAE